MAVFAIFALVASMALFSAATGRERTITRERALEIAWREEARPDATGVRAELGTWSYGPGSPEIAVWTVIYEGVCMRAHGVLVEPGPPECFASEYQVVIDARTGGFLVAGANELPAENSQPSAPVGETTAPRVTGGP